MRCIICDSRLELSRRINICPECSDQISRVYEDESPSDYEDHIYIVKETQKNG